MANVLAELFQNTADAIREKTGDTGTMKPAEFPEKIRGIDAKGNLVPLSVTENGTYIPSGEDIDGYSSVEVNVPNAIEGQTVHKITFLNYDGTELYSRYVFDGDDCESPVTKGQIAKPTRETDVRYIYTFSGWTSSAGGTANSTILNDIAEDKTVYAAYSTTYVYYTVNWYDGETLMKTEQVHYGGTATPPSTEKSGYVFDGWGTEDYTIYEDTDFYGTWSVDTAYAVKMADAEELPTAKVTGLAYNADGTRLLAVNPTALYEYDATTEPYTLIGTHSFYTPASNSYKLDSDRYIGVQYINNGAYYVVVHEVKSNLNNSISVANTSFRIAIFDATTHELVKELTQFVNNTNTSYCKTHLLKVSHDTTKFALIGYYYNMDYIRVYSFDGTDITLVGSCNPPVINQIQFNTDIRLISASFNADDTSLVFTCYASKTSYYRICVIDLATFTDITTTVLDSTALSKFKGDSYGNVIPIRAVYTPDGKLIVRTAYNSSSSYDNVYVYDTSTTPYTLINSVTGNALLKYGLSSNNPYGVLAISPNSKVIAHVGNSGSNTERLRFYDCDTLLKLEAPETNLTGQPSLAGEYNPSGTHFATGCISAPYLYVYKCKV